MPAETPDEEYIYELEQRGKGTQDQGAKKIIKNLEPKHLFWIIVLILVVTYFVKNNTIKMEESYWYIAIIIIFILLVAYRMSKENEYITMEEAKAMVESYAIKQQQSNRIPMGELIMLQDCKLQTYDSQPWRWSVGIMINSIEGTTVIFEGLVDVHRGRLGIMGLLPRRTGYDPTKREDLRPIPTSDMYWDRKKEKYQEEGRRGLKQE